jgi:hypothetical protein
MAQVYPRTAQGTQLIAEGLELLRQAWRDAVKGSGLVLSGVGLILVDTWSSAWRGAGRILGRGFDLVGAGRWASARVSAGLHAFGAALSGLVGLILVDTWGSAWRDAGRILGSGFDLAGAGRWALARVSMGLRAFGAALSGLVRFVFAARTILWLAWAAALLTLVVYSTPQVDWMSALSQLTAAIPTILTVAVGLAALITVALILGRLLGWIGGLFTPSVLRALAASVLFISAGAVLTMLATWVSPPPLLAWVALAALLAGGAGFAVVSLGPTRISVWSLRGGGEQANYPQSEDVIDVAFERADGELQSGAALSDQRVERGAASARTRGPPRRLPGFGLVFPAAIGLSLAALGVLTALWVRSPEGEAQVRSFWAALQPAPVKSEVAPPSNQAQQEGHALSLVADGRPGEVYWRRGYRSATERMDDGRTVQTLTLPPEVCNAAVIVAFGSASSDGPREPNMRLARHRALWAADWARGHLPACPPVASARTIIAVSLGQAVSGAASSDQRRVRVIALSDLADAQPERLRRISLSLLSEMRTFEAFEVCAMSEGPGVTSAWCP